MSLGSRVPRRNESMRVPLRVLIAEDSEDDARLLLRELDRAGYQAAHERVDNPAAMAAALDRQAWDLVFGDYSMPGGRQPGRHGGRARPPGMGSRVRRLQHAGVQRARGSR